MSEPQEKKRGGRPKASEPSTTVCVWVPASAHDRLIKLANQREMSLSTFARVLLIRAADRAGGR